MKSLSVAKAILFGGLAVGTLDLLDAIIFFGIRSGAQPMGILRSIAAGFLGRDAARAGGVPTAIVGLFSHYLVAFSIVTIYVLMSRVIPLLRTQWVVCGLVFGIIAYFVMMRGASATPFWSLQQRQLRQHQLHHLVGLAACERGASHGRTEVVGRAEQGHRLDLLGAVRECVS